MTPPQVTAIDEVDLRSMSDLELAGLWVLTTRQKGDARNILREFRIREWERHQECAEAYDILKIPPQFRPLRVVSQ